VAQICRKLDGIPLGLELAAARANFLSMEQIASRLEDCFPLLAAGGRSAIPRHQTMKACLDWSYHLLTETEQVLLNRLAIFAGGWTLDAAEAVCAGRGIVGLSTASVFEHATADPSTIETREVLNLLNELVNKSMVVSENQPGQEMRCRFLEPSASICWKN
jgi:hypothetical protein